MSEQGLIQAEQRVREMNRVTRQYTEQGNRFMQQNFQNRQNNQTRFEQVRPGNTYGGGQNPPGQNSVPHQQDAQASQHAQPMPPKPPANAAQLDRDPPRQNSPVGNFSAGKTPIGSGAFLADLKLDNEKLMIMLILYLLIKEKADIKLILALGYLLL